MSRYSLWSVYYKLATKIAKQENADFKTVQLAALLHDVDDIKLSPDTYVTKKNAVDFMTINKIDGKRIEVVCKIIDEVMICDDAAFMRMMIKDILTKNGYEIAAEAENGAIAVEKYPEAKPDLVLMDITMPDMDGIQALKKIKEIDANANVIMCSAMGQQAMVIEAIQSGAKDFIVKPFQAERVLEAVKKVVG